MITTSNIGKLIAVTRPDKHILYGVLRGITIGGQAVVAVFLHAGGWEIVAFPVEWCEVEKEIEDEREGTN